MPFFYGVIRRFVIAAIVIPLAIAGVRKVSEVVEQRRGGPSRTTRLLRKGADTAESVFGTRNRRSRSS
jgi:hypothetical protein